MTGPGAPRHGDEAGSRPTPGPLDRSDQLSPNRALQESLGASTSQRVGDNEPIANPVVSFPDEPGEGGGASG
jgi:hypothetical protein